MNEPEWAHKAMSEAGVALFADFFNLKMTEK